MLKNLNSQTSLREQATRRRLLRRNRNSTPKISRCFIYKSTLTLNGYLALRANSLLREQQLTSASLDRPDYSSYVNHKQPRGQKYLRDRFTGTLLLGGPSQRKTKCHIERFSSLRITQYAKVRAVKTSLNRGPVCRNATIPI